MRHPPSLAGQVNVVGTGFHSDSPDTFARLPRRHTIATLAILGKKGTPHRTRRLGRAGKLGWQERLKNAGKLFQLVNLYRRSLPHRQQDLPCVERPESQAAVQPCGWVVAGIDRQGDGRGSLGRRQGQRSRHQGPARAPAAG